MNQIIIVGEDDNCCTERKQLALKRKLELEVTDPRYHNSQSNILLGFSKLIQDQVLSVLADALFFSGRSSKCDGKHKWGAEVTCPWAIFTGNCSASFVSQRTILTWNWRQFVWGPQGWDTRTFQNK